MAKRSIPVRLVADIARYVRGMQKAQEAQTVRVLLDGKPVEFPVADHTKHMHVGGYVPVEGWAKLDPDECVVRRDGKCLRAEHPTATSDCADSD